MRSPRRNGSEAGFTILELMIAIAVFAIVVYVRWLYIDAQRVDGDAAMVE